MSGSSSSSSSNHNDHDLTFMKDYGAQPTQPFEIEIARDALRRRIEAGEFYFALLS